MVSLIFWWMLLAWAALVAGYLIMRYWQASQHKRVQNTNETPVAHSTNLTGLPEYVVAFKRYRLYMRWTAGVLSLCLLASVVLSARPSMLSNINPIRKNRDIMLCLDASGSVLKADTMLINRFSALVSGFSGQRFGLTLFNSSAVTVIPLNDNYQLTSDQLKAAGQAFKDQKGDDFTKLTDGTLAGFQSGTSLASDGLATCVQRMGTNSAARSQSIVLATDNEVNGTPVVGMTQAIQLAKQRNIHIFTLDPGVSDTKLAGDHTQLKLVASQTDGSYYMLSDDNAVNNLISDISKQEPAKFVGLPQPAINDNPQPFLYMATLLAIVSLVLLWRLEL